MYAVMDEEATFEMIVREIPAFWQDLIRNKIIDNAHNTHYNVIKSRAWSGFESRYSKINYETSGALSPICSIYINGGEYIEINLSGCI